MTPADPIPFAQMCSHAYDSCKVNGLMPVAYRWGPDVRQAYVHHAINHNIKGIGVPSTYGGLPVYRMRAEGVACIGWREKLLLGIKPFPPPY